MSDYPFWWDKTVTVYNKKVDSQTQRVTWYRHVVHNCFWKYVNDVSLGDKVVYETKQVICRIPKSPKYQEWYEWESGGDTWTLHTGDILVNCELTEDIDEYSKGKRSTDLLARYKDAHGCLEVETFTVDTGDGLCCEHYHVRGR